MANKGYDPKKWDKYARSHASVLTSFQLELYREAASHLVGDVIDCGCGTARLMPFLAGSTAVSSYVGVDSSAEMVTTAQWILQRLQKPTFRIINSKIEEVGGCYTSAVSIHSYYAWPDPLAILRHIYTLLSPGTTFVLATPNQSLDMGNILYEAEKELIAHPDYDEFKALNQQFANHPVARFIPMDQLIHQVRSVGFHIVECHQKHYMGGVNYLILSKD